MKIISLDADIAKEYGFPAACVFHSLCFYIELNKANGRNFHDGRTWCYNSVKAWGELFYWMSGAQVRSALDKLEKSGLIVSGNYNEVAYDRTKWYALTALGEKLSPSSHCDFSQIHLRNLTNGFAENSEPIPVSNTVTNTDISSGSRCEPDPAPKVKEEEPKEAALREDARHVIDYLNEKSGKSYRHSASSVNAILPRLREGFTVDDCKRVIDSRCEDWLGSEMEQYLRPSTLFRASKFEGYLQAAGAPKGKPKEEPVERWKSAKELQAERAKGEEAQKILSYRIQLDDKGLEWLARWKASELPEMARLGLLSASEMERYGVSA